MTTTEYSPQVLRDQLKQPAAADWRTPAKRDRLLPLPDVEALTATKKSTIYKLIGEGRFPSPIQITARRVAWPESRVLQWVQERIAEADQQAGK